MEPLLPLDRATIFFDGSATETRLRHPEGVAVDTAGNVWCGGEEGEIYRIDRDGSNMTLVASTGGSGSTLGLAFDDRGHLYTCDAGHAAVYRLDTASGRLERFARERGLARLRIPNFPVVDLARGCLYVSDSYAFDRAGPGIWRFDLASGDGELWYDRPLRFANGMALAPDRRSLYLAETFGRRVLRIPLDADGGPGEAEVVLDAVERLPDGLAIDVEGNLYVTCYEPSLIYRVAAGRLELLVSDPDAHTLCHPTNCAFRGRDLFVANLGRRHITRVELDVEGPPLPLAPRGAA